MFRLSTSLGSSAVCFGFAIIINSRRTLNAMKCSQCGTCCRLFLINLTEEEYKSGKYKTMFDEFGVTDNFEEAEMCAANTLAQKEDGSCIYLKADKCSIHENRPNSCKNFFCSSKNPEFREMIKKIKQYKKQNGSKIPAEML